MPCSNSRSAGIETGSVITCRNTLPGCFNPDQVDFTVFDKGVKETGSSTASGNIVNFSEKRGSLYRLDASRPNHVGLSSGFPGQSTLHTPRKILFYQANSSFSHLRTSLTNSLINRHSFCPWLSTPELVSIP